MRRKNFSTLETRNAIVRHHSPPPSKVSSFENSPKKKTKQITKSSISSRVISTEAEDDYILKNNSDVETLSNFAYPEIITEQCFHKLSKRGGCSESIAKITEIMQLEKDFRKKYHGNRIMYKNWFWLHEDEKTDLVPIY